MKPGFLLLLLAPMLLLSAPSRGGSRHGSADAPPLQGPDVVISAEAGFILSPAPTGQGDGEAVTIPRKGQDYDFDGLRKRLVELRVTYPKLPAANIRPGKEVPWWVVVHTIEMTRKAADGKPLFPVVFLGL